MTGDPPHAARPADVLRTDLAEDVAVPEVPSQTHARSGSALESERRRRRDQVFGDVLPEGTGDDRTAGWGDPDAGVAGLDEWLRRQVPPHHG